MFLVLEDSRKLAVMLLELRVNDLDIILKQRFFLKERVIVMLRRYSHPSADGAYPTSYNASGWHHPEVHTGAQGVVYYCTKLPVIAKLYDVCS